MFIINLPMICSNLFFILLLVRNEYGLNGHVVEGHKVEVFGTAPGVSPSSDAAEETDSFAG